MKRASTVSIRIVAALGLAYSLYAARTRPLMLSEAQLWADLIRPTLSESLRAPDAWGGLLYGILAERCVGLLRLSEFALRVPALLAGVCMAWSVWRSTNVFQAAAYAAATSLGWFSTAQGQGIALALCLVQPPPSGWRLGLAIAFSPPFAVLLLIYCRLREIERVVIPAVVTAFVLLLIPATHAGPASSTDRRPDFYAERDRRNAARGGGFQPPTADCN
jgi:hypothetical protein